jgi:hypothetical protein
MATTDDRQQKILDHLARSSGEFAKPLPLRSVERKQRILDHLRRSIKG